MDAFQIILAQLQPDTLAGLARDLAEALEDWEFYPEDAPPEPARRVLNDALALAIAVGQALDPAFMERVEQAQAVLDEADWPTQRNRQTRQNWFNDLQ
jgi:hypothetical protein